MNNFLGFSRLSGTLVKFSIKSDDFGFDFHEMSFVWYCVETAETLLMPGLYGNGLFKRAAHFGSCRSISSK